MQHLLQILRWPALGWAGVFSYYDSVLPCDRCEYEVVPKENEEDHKILKQVSRDAPPVVKQDTFKCDYCHKAFFGGNSLMEHIRVSHDILCSHCSGGFS